jgi:signal transduction histidine kinase
MPQSLRYIIVSFIVFAIILIALSWFSYQQVIINEKSTVAVEHTQKVLLISEQFISQMKDIETAQRGFLLTKNRSFLEPFESGRKGVLNSIDSLRELVVDNSIQLRSLDKIEELCLQKIKFITKNIKEVSQTGKINFTVLENGKKTMDTLRGRINTFQANEKDLLSIRMQSKKYGQSLMPIYQVMLSLASFVLLIVAYYLVYAELKRRNRLEKTLEGKIDELNRSNTELEQFAYVASHDLQEPLRKIRAFSDKLQVKHKTNLNEDGKDVLDKIANSAARMQALIDDLLSFSRMVNHKSSNLTMVDLNHTVKEVLEDLSVQIQAKNAKIQIPILPRIFAYEVQMKQLFDNLISNALKYTREGVEPNIKIEYQQVRGKDLGNSVKLNHQVAYHHFSISDNGIGFENQYAENIFVIFQRLHNRSQYEGNGIGLAICKRIVVNHQGFIFATSKPYEGSTFDVYIPLKKTA